MNCTNKILQIYQPMLCCEHVSFAPLGALRVMISHYISSRHTRHCHNTRCKSLKHDQCNSEDLRANKHNNQTTNAVEVARKSDIVYWLNSPLKIVYRLPCSNTEQRRAKPRALGSNVSKDKTLGLLLRQPCSIRDFSKK